MLQVYFNKEAMLEAGAIVKQHARGSSKDVHIQDVLHFGHHNIDISRNGIVYVCEGDLQYEIPTDLEKFVTEISYYDNFGNGLHPTRRLGEYRLGTAVGGLETVGSSHYHLKLRAKNMNELRELFQLIRQGQIWPAKDYEAEQVPPPFRHLRDAFAEIWQLIRRDLHDRLYRIKERLVF